MTGDRAGLFERRNGNRWRRLRKEAAAHAGTGRVPPGQVVAFARSYRDLAADLSAARAMGCRPEVIFELNGLVALAHGVVYRRAVRRHGREAAFSLLRFAFRGFPTLVWRHRGMLALAVLLFLVPAVLGYGYVASDPGGIHDIFGSLESVIGTEAEKAGASINPMPATLTAFYWVNNIMVALLCFAFGMLLGLGTAYLLALNGFILGALAAHFAAQGALGRFWPQVLPHATTEVLAIFVAAQGGFLLARALWRPGEWSRRDALGRAGRDAGLLMLGAILLLVVAGIVESWFTRSVADDGIRNAFAAVSAVAVAAWLWIGRETEAAAAGTG